MLVFEPLKINSVHLVLLEVHQETVSVATVFLLDRARINFSDCFCFFVLLMGETYL